MKKFKYQFTLVYAIISIIMLVAFTINYKTILWITGNAHWALYSGLFSCFIIVLGVLSDKSQQEIINQPSEPLKRDIIGTKPGATTVKADEETNDFNKNK